MRFSAAISCLCAIILVTGPRATRAADPMVDSAVAALAQLTDPRRLEPLPESDFRAQLGPALGWLHVARRRDVSPESVIARAFVRNGLDGERARLTREALLRNLARADAWELFDHPESARALSDGRPAPIPTGIHRGHLAQAAVVLPEGLGPQDRREFACLVLRADDEKPPRPPRGTHRRQPGDTLARAALPSAAGRRLAHRFVGPPAAGTAVVQPVAPSVADDGALPVSYTTLGNDSGRIVVREEVSFGQAVSLSALGGPARRFVLRGADGGSARFDLTDEGADETAPPRAFTVPLAQEQPAGGGTRVWRICEEPGALRISLYEAAPEAGGDVRTVLFEFPPGRREGAREIR